MFGVTHQHVLGLAKAGRLRPIKVGEPTAFDRADVARRAAARRMAPPGRGPRVWPVDHPQSPDAAAGAQRLAHLQASGSMGVCAITR